MTSFRFRLDPLLDHRREEEKDRAREVVSARSAEEVLRRREADLRALQESGRALLRGAHHSGGPAGHLRNLEFILERVEEEAVGAGEERRAAEARLNATMQEYSRAVQARQVLERLKERRQESWRSDAERRAQGTLDEQAVIRHARGG